MKGNCVEQENLYKIRKLKEFNLLKKNGKKIAGNFYFFVFLPSEKKEFAVIASKKVGNAVRRNYEKRIMRILARKYFHLLDSTKCLIIRIPRREGSYLQKEKDFQNQILKLKNMSRTCDC